MLIKQQLLIDLPSFVQITFSFLSMFKHSCFVAFMIAIILNFFNVGDAESTCRKTFLAIILYSLVVSFFVPVTDYIFELSDSIIGAHNYFLSDYGTTLGKYAQDTKYTLFGNHSFLDQIKENVINPNLNFILVSVINIFMFFIVGLLKLVYTVIYYIGTAILWIPLSIYILPGRDSFMTGIINGLLWLLVVPILLAIYCKFGSEIIANSLSESKMIGSTIEGTVLLMVMTCGMLGMEAFAFFIVNGSGVAAGGATLAGLGTSKAIDFASMSAAIAVGGAAGGATGGLGGALTGAAQGASGKGVGSHLAKLGSHLSNATNENTSDTGASDSHYSPPKKYPSLKSCPISGEAYADNSNDDPYSVSSNSYSSYRPQAYKASYDPITGESYQNESSDQYHTQGTYPKGKQYRPPTKLGRSEHDQIVSESIYDENNFNNGVSSGTNVRSTPHRTIPKIDPITGEILDEPIQISEDGKSSSRLDKPITVDTETGKLKF